MARNQEKAQAMLNRFYTAKKEALMGVEQKRPFLATEVESLPEAERWRNQILKEVSKSVSNIQNGSLGEHKIRDLNDKINKLLREKKHWERQIKILGGPDYMSMSQRVADADGRNAMGGEGYYYFGAARELPGVRELFEKTRPVENKRTRYDLYKLIDGDYYGYRDDDDGKLEVLEKKAELKAMEKAEEEWIASQIAQKKTRYRALGMDMPGNEPAPVINKGGEEDDLYKAHVPLPSRAEIEALVVEAKKKELLAKYGVSYKPEEKPAEVTA
jgi:pre-mRNA-splicing factor ISY1